MAYRRLFRRKNLLPGVHMNLSKAGPSLSFGVRCTHATVRRRGVMRTVGIPHTGVFYTSRIEHHTGPTPRTGSSPEAQGLAPRRGSQT